MPAAQKQGQGQKQGRKKHRMNAVLENHPFIFEFGMMAEVYQEADLEACCVEVIEKLGLVFIREA